MSLYSPLATEREIVVTVYHEFKEHEKIAIKGFKKAFRHVRDLMKDRESDVYGGSFELKDGGFLKEIHF